jgi:serine/threonine protein phosphatase PrpC
MLAVVDGAGGTAMGRKAADIAEDVFKAYEFGRQTLIDQDLSLPRQTGTDQELLLEILNQANIDILTLNEGNPKRGVAAIAAIRYDHKRSEISVMGIGDCRIYLYSPGAKLPTEAWNPKSPKGALSSLLQPHNMAQAFRNHGITPGENAENVLLKALGHPGQFRLSDVSTIPPVAVKEGSVVVMASDGLNKGVADSRIEEICARVSSKAMSVEEASGTFIQEARRGGSTDNISAITLRIGNT